MSNGTLVCGLTAEGESALLCLHVADGTEAWRTAPSWDLPAAFSGSPDFVFHGDTLFGAGAAKAYAWDLATGHERWTRKNAPAWRALIFLGDDLVMENSAACESTAASCFEALDPLTGEVKTTFPAKGGAAFLFAKGGVGYWLTPPKALFVGDQKIVRYDSATHAFSDATTDLAALADTIVPGEYAYGLTPTLADGGVYISHGAPPSVSVCRWDTTTLTKTWCAVTQGALGGIRVHPNVLFVTALYGGRAQGFKPSDGASPSVAFALWFEEFGFNGSSYGVLE